jgi:hypothetical protein
VNAADPELLDTVHPRKKTSNRKAMVGASIAGVRIAGVLN